MNLKFMKFNNETDGRVLTWRDAAPNLVTSGNLVSGIASLILTYHGHFAAAGWAVFLAVFFDLMDGMVARKLNTGSQFGLEFDSIADVVSFGAAPAFLVYVVYLQHLWILGAPVACLFALCGGLRLARFNVVHSPGGFQGIPIPAAGLFVSSFVIAEVPLYSIIAAAITLVAAVLMVSSVPYGSLKSLRKGHINKIKLALLLILIISMFALGGKYGALIMMSAYVVSGPLRFDWGKWLSIPETAGNES